MAETYETPTLIIRYKGLFDFNGLYNLMVQWMKARRFWFHEDTYKHKVPTALGAEQELLWKGNKKITEFYMQDIRIYIHLWDMTEVEVVQKGVTKKLTNARIEMIISGVVTIDYEKRWEESTFYMALLDFYRKYIAKEEIETGYTDQLYYRMYKLHAAIKEFLDMQAKGNEYAGYLGDNV